MNPVKTEEGKGEERKKEKANEALEGLEESHHRKK